MQQAAAEKRIARALSLAVQKPTIANGPGAPFMELHTVLRELFPLVFSVGAWETVDQRALLGCLPGHGDGQPLLFLSHMDVFPIRTPEKWSVGPFAGEIRDGFVYGRGTVDMKGHLIALLTAAEALLSQGFRPKGNIWFAFSCDEEIRGGSMQKMCRILESRHVKPAFVLDEGGSITGLPTLCEKPIALIGVAEKGRMCFTLTADGDKSTEALLHAGDRLLRMHFMPRICPVTSQTLIALADEMTGFQRFCATHPGRFQDRFLRKLEHTVYGQALSRTQVKVSALSGDALKGQEAGISFQASVLPGEETAELLRRIERVTGDPRLLVTVDVMDEPSLISPTQGFAWDALTTAIHVHFPGTPIAPYLLTGASDARRMEPLCPYIYRFSPFVLPPEELKREHGIDERISIENLLRGSAFFKQMLMA
ncbi:MAG: M20/M25/M40 family metallo-hydrolase [Clostridia bacterium]|nr:M20/M25/M40 family metallo-hydrolase [Clostridia bacterium]